MQKILELTGFEMQGDFLTDNRYLTEIVPIVTNEPIHSQAYNENLKFDAYKTVNQTVTALSDLVTFPNIINDPFNLFDGTYYTADSSGTYSFRLIFKYVELTVMPPMWPKFVINKMDNGGNVTEIASYQTDGTDTNVFLTLEYQNLQLLQGEKVFVKVFLIDDINVLTGSNFSVVGVTDTIINYSNLFEINGNMPEMTLKEFVKSLAQRYNLLFKADVVSQVITILTYDEVYNATPLDWTDRLDVGGRKVDFHPAFFGQNNQFRWADETNNPVDYANGQLLISDEILSKAIVTIQQPFAASLDVIRFDNVSVSQIPLLEYDEISVSSGDAPAIAAANQVIIYNVTPNILNTLGFQTSAVYKLTTVKPRLLYVDLTVMSDELVYDDGTNTAQDANAEPLTWFWNDSAYNLTFVDNENGLIDNYISLAFSFGRFKKLTVLMNLTAIDALTFAFDRTITINPYGRFYVNKINNYQPNQLTEVELIKV
jgi:hypothetical protein